MFVLLIVSLVLVIVCYELFYDRKAKAAAKKIPGPPVYPVIGNGHLFIGSAAKFRNTVNYLFEEFGDRSRVFLGPELFVFISNPEDVEAVTSSMDYINKSQDYESLKPWLGDGLLIATGQKWKRHRKFLTPTFHFNILQDFVPVFEKNVNIMVDSLSDKCEGQQVFDIYPYVTLCALDDICETAMGVVMGAQQNCNSEYVKAVKDMSYLANYRMRHFLLRNKPFFNMSRTKAKQTNALKILHEFTENVIKDRKKQLSKKQTTINTEDDLGIKKRTTFLDLLLLSQVDGSSLSDQSIREEVDTFMFEGHDTTTSALSFALYLISKHPVVQDKLIKEQEAIFRNDFTKDASYSDLNEMKYMELVIKESLRLFPSVPLMGRRMAQDTVINGMELPAGTTVLVDVFHLQRNPKLYEEPLQFRPERFEVDNVNKRSPFSWVAFSAGPRNCIGQKFAILEIKCTLSRLLRAYEFTCAGVEPELSLNLILKPENGIMLSIRKRTIVDGTHKSVKLRRND